MATIRYLAYISEKPEALAAFYARYLKTMEIGHSAAGDISISYGFLNLILFKKRLSFCEARRETSLAIHPFYNAGSKGHEMKFGINHIGFLVNDLKAAMEELSGAAKINKRPTTGPTPSIASPTP